MCEGTIVTSVNLYKPKKKKSLMAFGPVKCIEMRKEI